MTVLAFNYVDRLALGLVLQGIKTDLHLTDTELGVLSGIAFALFYSVMGLPIARWADRGNRVTIIALTTAVWSVMVALCGVAMSFVQLMAIRIGVGVGEAGCLPPANSLIAEYFSRAERPRATAIYLQGTNVSLILAYFVAGWLSQFYGWRVMFMLISLPGFALAVVVVLTIREPRRAKSRIDKEDKCPSADPLTDNIPSPVQSNLKDTLVILWANVTFRHLLYALSVFYFFAYGILQWQPAFFVRSFGLETGELGTWFASIYGVGGILGTYWGGALACRYAPNNERAQLRAMAVVNAVFNGAVWSLIYFTQNQYLAFALMGLSTMGGAAINGPLYATIQTLVPAHMRAVSIALILLFANLIGMGLGPLAVGVLSDVLHPLFRQESLRYALLALCPGYLWTSWHLWQASKSVIRDLEIVKDNIPDAPRANASGETCVTS